MYKCPWLTFIFLIVISQQLYEGYAIQFGADIQCPQRMNLHNSGDPLAFPQVQLTSQNIPFVQYFVLHDRPLPLRLSCTLHLKLNANLLNKDREHGKH